MAGAVSRHGVRAMAAKDPRMGWQATWAMAVGGMIGGGIYTLAGVVFAHAGGWAWLSLLAGGAVAVITAISYARLLRASGRGGIPVSLLDDLGRRHAAGIAAWSLLVLYVITTAVYAFTFGHYVVAAFDADPALAGAIEVGIIAALTAVNVRGIREPVRVQITAVWIELSVLVLLAAVGFISWQPENLTRGVPQAGVQGILLGAAVTFVAFEGFEMLTYDTAEIRAPRRTLRTALPVAVVVVALAYSLATVGSASLVGADRLVANKEAALAYAARNALGTPGLVVVTCAAAASAASAINATLFSAARLLRTCARRELLPALFARSNRRQSPAAAIFCLSALSAVVAATSTLDALVQTASLAFLVLFAGVNVLAAARLRKRRWLAGIGAAAAVLLAVGVAATLVRSHPAALVALVGALAAAVIGHLLTTVAHARGQRRRVPARLWPRPGA